MGDGGNDRNPHDGSDREPAEYHVRYDPETDESLSTVVVKAVSAVSGTPPTELGSLYETVDPEAIDTVYETIDDFPHHDKEGYLTFTFGDCDVTVHWTGTISIRPSEEARPE